MFGDEFLQPYGPAWLLRSEEKRRCKRLLPSFKSSRLAGFRSEDYGGSSFLGDCIKDLIQHVEVRTVNYRVLIEQDEDGVFVARCPSLPGCTSQGKTRSEALATIKDA